jgi:hypothetical protein
MTRNPYEELYKVGSVVRIADLAALEEFQRTWKYHHPLKDSQLASAGRTATVTNVMFYHGGDVLYELRGASGIWHEALLNAPSA